MAQIPEDEVEEEEDLGPTRKEVLWEAVEKMSDIMVRKDMPRKYSKMVGCSIGNSRYEFAPFYDTNNRSDSRTPTENAWQMAELLEEMDYDVVFKELNLSGEEMHQFIMHKFLPEITPGSMVVFYFTGHGLQMVKDEDDIPTRALPEAERIEAKRREQEEAQEAIRRKKLRIVEFTDKLTRYTKTHELQFMEPSRTNGKTIKTVASIEHPDKHKRQANETLMDAVANIMCEYGEFACQILVSVEDARHAPAQLAGHYGFVRAYPSARVCLCV